MRTITAAKQAILTGGHGAQFSRLSVKDSGGVFRDLTALFNQDWLCSWTLNADLDAPCATLNATIAREAGGGSQYAWNSLSPLKQSTHAYRLNSSPLITAGSEILLETALVPPGVGWSGPWEETFRGYIDVIDFGKNPMTIAARDYGGRLEDLFVKTDKAYASASMELVIQAIIKDAHGIQWTTGTTKVAQSGTTPGDIVTPITDAGADNAFYYRCTTGGTTHASTEPTWPTTIGGTVSDNTVTWTCEGTVPVLWTPSATSFTLNAFTQQPMSVMEAIRKIADVIGWDIRYAWKSDVSQWRPKLYAPTRTSPSSLYTWDKDHYFKDPSFTLDRTTIRNHVEVTWSDPAALDTNGRATRKTTTATDWASMLAFTNKLPAFCSIAEGATSQIDTSGEASDLAGRILSDLKDPKVQAQYLVPLFSNVELGDYYTFSADFVAFDYSQSLAVTGYTHEAKTNGAINTTLRMRGIPASGVQRWIAKEAKSVIPVRTLGPAAPTISACVLSTGGFTLVFTAPVDAVTIELHGSTSNGFTPSNSTLWRVLNMEKSSVNAFVVDTLTPGTTYYIKLIARDRFGSPSAASSQQTATPSTWTTPSFGTNWTGWGDATYGDPRYTKSTGGIVYVEGIAKNTNAANLTVFTFAAGSRPGKALIVPIVSSAGLLEARIYTDGRFDVLAPVLNGWHSCGGISFVAEG